MALDFGNWSRMPDLVVSNAKLLFKAPVGTAMSRRRGMLIDGFLCIASTSPAVIRALWSWENPEVLSFALLRSVKGLTMRIFLMNWLGDRAEQQVRCLLASSLSVVSVCAADSFPDFFSRTPPPRPSVTGSHTGTVRRRSQHVLAAADFILSRDIFTDRRGESHGSFWPFGSACSIFQSSYSSSFIKSWRLEPRWIIIWVCPLLFFILAFVSRR